MPMEVISLSKWDKLIARVKTLSKDIRFDELKKILESYGYVMRETSGGSSHATFRKNGRDSITIPRHSPIKKVYVELVRDAIEREENHERY